MRELLLAFAEVLHRAEMFESHQVERERLSTRERMSRVLEILQAGQFVPQSLAQIQFFAEPLVSLIFDVAGVLVFVGKKEGRNRSVRLGDYPNFYIVSGSIRAKDSETIVNRKFIFSFVLFTELAPISRLMSF